MWGCPSCRIYRSLKIVVALALVLPVCANAAGPVKHGTSMMSFAADAPEIPRRDDDIDYDIALDQERYLLHVPGNYTGNTAFGLIVYTCAGDEMSELPVGWASVLAQRRLLFIAAQNAGNQQPDKRRMGLAVLGALKMMRQCKIDPNRVYAAGFSGGARISGKLAFTQPEVFRGTIQSCGADFYDAVPRVRVKEEDNYGRAIHATPEAIERTKKGVRFSFVTGEKDFRYAHILDIYHGGYAKAGFQAKLVEVRGMDHVDCSGAALTTALEFVDKDYVPAAVTASSQPVIPKPDWLSNDPAQWPPILLSHDARFKDNQGLTGASGVVVRLPNGAVVAATARHLLKGTDLNKLEASIVNWVMHPRTMPARRVTLRKLAMSLDPPADGEPMDGLLMTVAPMPNWPVEVLPVRQTPLVSGEKIYLIAVPYESKHPQNVYPTVLLDSRENHEFSYVLPENVETRGFSGAPLIDADGCVVGLHLGKITFDDGRVVGRALEMSALANLANVAAPAATATKTEPKTSVGGAKAPASDAAADAAAATKALMMAKNYVTAKRLDVAKEKLQAIILKYPKTPAGQEAKALLEKLDAPNPP